MQSILTSIIDFFYPPFRRIMPLQTFRYAACGGGNTVLGLLLYRLGLFYFDDKNVHLSFVVLKPHNAALFIASFTCLFVGFILNKYIVFTQSNLRGHIQLFRYVMSFLLNLVINYFLLRLFVEVLHVEEFLAQVISTLIVILFSYLTQKHFTFKSKG